MRMKINYMKLLKKISLLKLKRRRTTAVKRLEVIMSTLMIKNQLMKRKNLLKNPKFHNLFKKSNLKNKISTSKYGRRLIQKTSKECKKRKSKKSWQRKLNNFRNKLRN